jgi:hypothetical protein
MERSEVKTDEDHQEKAEPDERFVPLSTSAASLILVAMYGEPPRSGWFSSMTVRCAFLTSALLLASLQSARGQQVGVQIKVHAGRGAQGWAGVEQGVGSALA